MRYNPRRMTRSGIFLGRRARARVEAVGTDHPRMPVTVRESRDTVRMSDSIKLGSVALECPAARQLAAFGRRRSPVLAAGATKFDVPADHPFCPCIEGALSQA